MQRTTTLLNGPHGNIGSMSASIGNLTSLHWQRQSRNLAGACSSWFDGCVRHHLHHHASNRLCDRPMRLARHRHGVRQLADAKKSNRQKVNTFLDTGVMAVAARWARISRWIQHQDCHGSICHRIRALDLCHEGCRPQVIFHKIGRYAAAPQGTPWISLAVAAML